MAEAPVNTNEITLSEICKELGIKPQAARVKLRRKLADAKGEGFRWVFPIERKEEIVTLLTPNSNSRAEKEDEVEGDDE